MDLIFATKAQALDAVLAMQSALDEVQDIQRKLRQAEAAGRTLEVGLLEAQGAKLTERLIQLSADIDRTRIAFMEEVQEVATATLAVMTRVAEMEVMTHGHS